MSELVKCKVSNAGWFCIQNTKGEWVAVYQLSTGQIEEYHSALMDLGLLEKQAVVNIPSKKGSK